MHAILLRRLAEITGCDTVSMEFHVPSATWKVSVVLPDGTVVMGSGVHAPRVIDGLLRQIANPQALV
jgi:hypothetical protein